MRTRKITLWLPQSIVTSMVADADSFFSNETGGSLMGYYSNRRRDIVVTNLIDCGPKSKHRKTSFIPDYSFQEGKIGRVYEQLRRIHTYLGDWHTHPGGAAKLSGKDIQTLDNIAVHAAARAPFPVMVLLSGNQGKWIINAWQLRSRKALKILLKKQLHELKIEYY